MDFLKDYLSKETVSDIVIGLPKDLNDKKTDATPYVKGFAKQIRNEFPDLDVHFIDERFTSKIAFQSMIDGGLKKKDRQNKALVDEVSATLILQSFMEQKKFKT